MTRTQNSLKQKATALLLAAVVLMLGLAAVSPSVHSLLHTNSECHGHSEGADSSHESSEESDHYCAVTVFQSGAAWSLQPMLAHLFIDTVTYLPEEPKTSPTLIFVLPGNRGPPIVEIT